MSEESSGSDLLVTIDDLLDDPTLSIQPAYVPAAAHSTPVSWVHATEQIDPRPHLRRNELVCTLGSSLVEARSAQRFVEAVADAGVAGIALGLGEGERGPAARDNFAVETLRFGARGRVRRRPARCRAIDSRMRGHRGRTSQRPAIPDAPGSQGSLRRIRGSVVESARVCASRERA
ncbi:MAG: hypothetical protein EBR52_07605 [Microbacteriaceae bacterium]|nr:hypothetical protein [Microbacteriaceae bacterium]